MDRIKAQQDNCIFDITDFGSKSIKKGRVRPADTALFLGADASADFNAKTGLQSRRPGDAQR